MCATIQTGWTAAWSNPLGQQESSVLQKVKVPDLADKHRGVNATVEFSELKLVLVQVTGAICHMYAMKKLCSTDWDLRVSIVPLAFALLWGASCSNKMASHWARKTCCLLFSAVSIYLWTLFNIFSVFHQHMLRLPRMAATSFYSSFVWFIFISCRQPLPPVFLLSSSRSVIHHLLALCQSVMHISLLFSINEIHPFFLSFYKPLKSTLIFIIHNIRHYCVSDKLTLSFNLPVSTLRFGIVFVHN